VNKIDAKHLSCDERLDALVTSIKRAISKSSRNSALLELAQIAKGYVHDVVCVRCVLCSMRAWLCARLFVFVRVRVYVFIF
jgi:hypothetical protein